MTTTSTAVSGSMVTFLFTDIEGSTQLWETYPDQMRVALARHDALVRTAIESNSGAVFKTIGDAFCATFNSAVDALAAVSVAQLAISEEAWPAQVKIKVRMALHTGNVDTRDNDFFGQTVNRVARLLSVAHGGQVVVSETSYQLVQDQLPEHVSFLDLGVHRLKDLVQHEHVYQILHPRLESEFPPLRSLTKTALPNNLPNQVTSFVGRDQEVTRISELIATTRIVTLTGAGGCGKTRLALRCAAEAADGFPDGVWFADLAPLSDPELVTESVSGLLGVREEAGQTLTQALAAHLGRKSQLLVLDNCEHLLMGCARLTSALLKSCPNLHVLATSREALNISGEAAFRVPSLSLPNPRMSSPEVVTQFESVRLFVDRARAVSSDFSVNQENARALASICHRLDGIPLAIELAAARVRSLSPEQISTRLDDRFRLLTGGSRTAMPRQQTLRALVDWSYGLLLEPERALLRRLAVFAGGWTLEAAETVADGDPVEGWEVLDLLTSLVDKSLVSFEHSGSSQRYRLLETVKRYGQEKLDEFTETEGVLEAHLEWYVRLASESGSWVRGPDQLAWLERLETEQDNFWLALETARQTNNASATARLAWTLALLLEYKGFTNEAVKAVEKGLTALTADPAADPLALARLRYERAGLHQDFGEADAASELTQTALAQFIELGDTDGIARAENLMGQIAMASREYSDAQSRFKTALELFHVAGDRIGVSIALNNLGVLGRRRRSSSQAEAETDLARAHEFLVESLKIRRECQDVMGQAETLNNLGVVAFERNDYEAAWSHYRDSLLLERELKRQSGIATALANLGEVAGTQGKPELALKLMALSQRVLEEVQSPLAGAVKSMFLDLAEGKPETDVRLWAASVYGPPISDCIDALVPESRGGAGSNVIQ